MPDVVQLFKKAWETALLQTVLLFFPLVAFALWGCGLHCGQFCRGGRLLPYPDRHPLVLTLTSFLEERKPSLAADAQDQGAQQDAHEKLHPAAESQKHTRTTHFWFGLVWGFRGEARGPTPVSYLLPTST